MKIVILFFMSLFLLVKNIKLRSRNNVENSSYYPGNLMKFAENLFTGSSGI